MILALLMNSAGLKLMLGRANEFKEGDQAIGVAARSDKQRQKARAQLQALTIRQLHEYPVYQDEQQQLIWQTTDAQVYLRIADWTLGQLKDFLLTQSEPEIKNIMPGLNSDVIAAVVKLMSNEELTHIGQTVFNPLPGGKIGSKGYMGARIQPNSPTDDPEDIQWQVFNGFSYAVGDVLLGTNPVDSTPESVAVVEGALQDIVKTFKLEQILPWSVLAHIDIQNEVEKKSSGLTDLFFQSIAGTQKANQTFGISVEKMLDYAQARLDKPHAFYFETGQGADFTNLQAYGVDMVTLESRKYGLARALKQKTHWVVLNDVAGFIGPEVFKSKEQLVRVCLEDIAMGKLHGLAIGLDICSTLHMDISLDDLQWCQDKIIPANPAYLMALPTRNDPMLSYLTTSFRDHVRIRNKFGTKVNDSMWEFFKALKVIDTQGNPTAHFGDPVWVYIQYERAKGDLRPEKVIRSEGQLAVGRVLSRGVPLDIQNDASLDLKTKQLYEDAKKSIWTQWSQGFIRRIPNVIEIKTCSKNRMDYINHPETGEKLSEKSKRKLEHFSSTDTDIQIVISDGLNARAIMQEGHLMPFLGELRKQLEARGMHVSKKHVVVHNGRVRAGYQIGRVLFSQSGNRPKTIIHVIGERPGNGHQSFSAYITPLTGTLWAAGKADHNLTKLVSGISNTSLKPIDAAHEVVKLLIPE